MKKKIIEYEICPRCDGKGEEFHYFILYSMLNGRPCRLCKGSGKVVMKEEITEE
jgi:DnaJ-class molecular chaperone